MKTRQWIFTATLLAGMATAPMTQASVLVDANFNSGTLANTGVSSGSYEVTPTFAANKGISGNTALDFGTSADGGIVLTPYQSAVSPIINFSLDALYQTPAGSGNPGSLAVDWINIPNSNSDGSLTAGQKINAATNYSGAGYPMNAMVGLGMTNLPATSASLAAYTGQSALQALSGNGIWYGGAQTSLQAGDWYQFSGTIWYDPAAGAFDFVNVTLEDLGSSGTAATPAVVLGGDGRVRTVFSPGFPQSDGTTESGGRLAFLFSGGSGFEYVNNLYADTGDSDMLPQYNSSTGSWTMVMVPEPASLGLLFSGGLCLLLRRRGTGHGRRSES